MICWGFMVLSILAHEFWIEPDRTRVNVGDTIHMDIVVGENFKGERWQGKGDRITMYKHLSTMGAIDLLNSIDPLTVTMLHDFTPVTEGTHVLALETNHSFIELEADEFEAYLREDGLESALEYRQQHGEQQMKGRERYKRCTKLMVQAGEEFDQTYKQPAYMAIEIFPVEHPYKLKESPPPSKFFLKTSHSQTPKFVAGINPLPISMFKSKPPTKKVKFPSNKREMAAT